MSAIPFGLVGAVLGHLVMGLNLTMLSMFGMVALTGVVVNDSLIMIDLINRERAAGDSVEKAIRESGDAPLPAHPADHRHHLPRADADDPRDQPAGQVPDPDGGEPRLRHRLRDRRSP